MDLENFKKVGSDKNHTIFEHPDGHRLFVSHKRVPHEIRQELNKVPVKHLYGGTLQSPLEGDEGPEPLTPAPDALGADVTRMGNGEGKLGALNNVLPSGDTVAGFIPFSGLFRDDPNAPKPVEQPTENQPLPAASNGRQPATATSQNSYYKDLKDASAGVQRGIREKAVAEGELGRQKAGEYQQGIQATEKLIRETDAKHAVMEKDLDEGIKALSTGEIKARDLFEGKDTWGKIGTALGLVFGGIGGGLTKQENPVLKFINQQMDRDIESQKATAAVKNNALRLMSDKYGSVTTAAGVKSAMQNQAIAMHIEQVAALMQDPIKKAEAEQLANSYKFNSLSTLEGAKQSAALDVATQQGGSAGKYNEALVGRIIATKVPHNLQAEVNKQYSHAAKIVQAHEAVDSIVDDIMKENKATNRILNPIQSSQAIKAKMAELVPLIMESNPSKRLTTESFKYEINPLMPGFLSGEKTADQIKQGLHRLTDTHADKTPLASAYLGNQMPRYVPKRQNPNMR